MSEKCRIADSSFGHRTTSEMCQQAVCYVVSQSADCFRNSWRKVEDRLLRFLACTVELG
jgi:hypothetical protein